MVLTKKLSTLVKSLLLYFFYNLKLVFHKHRCNGQRHDDVIVSLTSHGQRLSSVYLTICSLASQTVQPKSIVLWLSKEDVLPADVPGFLTILERSCSNFKIRFVDENLKSYKKVVHTYESFKEDGLNYIVTADDDVYYPANWLEKLLCSARENTNSVCAYRGHVIEFDELGVAKPYRSWKLADKKTVSGNNFLPTGVSGICYPVKSLEGVNDRDRFLENSPTADDIWLKFITTSNGYSSCLVGEESVHFVPVMTSLRRPQKGLEKINIFKDENSKSFSRLLKSFNLDLRSFK